MNTSLKIRTENLVAASLGWLSRAPRHPRVLTFHDVGDDTGNPFTVSKNSLMDYLTLLKDEGYATLRACDLHAGWPSVLDRERVVLLTFDDGYVAQKDIVAEMLDRWGMVATFFVITGFLGSKRTRRIFEGRQREFLSGADLRQMHVAGFEIGSHTHTHVLCGTVSEAQVEREVGISKQRIEHELGHAIGAFAYPYGRRRAFSQMTRAVLQRHGYQTAFTLEGTRLRAGSDLLRLPRTSIDGLDTIASFRRKLHGHYDLIGNVRHDALRY